MMQGAFLYFDSLEACSLVKNEAHGFIPVEMVRLSIIQEVNRSIHSELKAAAVNSQCPIAVAVVQEMESNSINMPNSTSCQSTAHSTRPNLTQSQQPGSGAYKGSMISTKECPLTVE